MMKNSFPEGFLWGGAMAASQADGAFDQGGKGLDTQDLRYFDPNWTKAERAAKANRRMNDAKFHRALADRIVALTGSKSKIIHLEARNDDPRHKTPDLTRARRMLEWQPSTSLDEGLRMAAGYFEKELFKEHSWVDVH